MFRRSANLIAVSSVLAVLAALAVVARFLARRLKGLRIWVDDYLIVVALVLSWGVCICNIVGAVIGRFGDHEIYQTSGPHKGEPLPELMMIYGKVCFACRLLHATAMQLLKISLLLFFWRIFEQSRRFVIVFWTCFTYVTLWWLVCFWLNVFMCYPIPWTWSTSPTMAEHCIPDFHMFFSYASLTNVISDVGIAIVPFPFLFSLPMSPAKKLAIGGMFLTGAVVIVAGIGRTVAFFTVGHTLDYTYENYYYLIWSSVEPCVGVIGCCLPTFRPLFFRGDSALGSYYSQYRGELFSSEPSPRRLSSTDNTSQEAPSPPEKHHQPVIRHAGTCFRTMTPVAEVQESSETSTIHDMQERSKFEHVLNSAPRLGRMNPTPPLPPLGRNSPQRGPLSQNPVVHPVMHKNIGRAL